MISISKHIDLVVKLALADVLKAAGFKKQARTFRRVEADGSLSIINVQADKYNEGSRGAFVVNLARYIPELADMAGETRLEKPGEEHGHFRARLGHVMGHLHDVDWMLDAHSDDAAIAAELRAAVVNHGLPWLDSLLLENFKRAGADFHSVPGGKPDGGRLYAAGFYWLAGEAEKARETLLLEIEHAPQRAARARE
ncbi:MAG: DUF4304 domain-containing protein [Cardiobacteriaceae bacterium]|nr:DUF4304 domain-containing protein [Cardiobacteriaceae bacterium]